VPSQVVQVCAEHKKPKKLLKHMASIKTLSAGQRNPPRTLVFAEGSSTKPHAPLVLDGVFCVA
jgi:ATP-dependent RNA helicase DDX5/DBP2